MARILMVLLLLLSGCAAAAVSPAVPSGAGIVALREPCLERLNYINKHSVSIQFSIERDIREKRLSKEEREATSALIGGLVRTRMLSEPTRQDTCSCQSAFMYERLPKDTRVQLDQLANGDRLSPRQIDRLQRDLVLVIGYIRSRDTVSIPLLEELVQRCPDATYHEAFMRGMTAQWTQERLSAEGGAALLWDLGQIEQFH